MLEQDYLVRMLAQFAAAIRRSMERAQGERDPQGAADMLEAAVGEATDFDGATLLALAPDSIASILQVSGTDPRVTEYMVRSLMLASRYRADAGDAELATLREEQARAIADAYGHDADAAAELLDEQ